MLGTIRIDPGMNLHSTLMTLLNHVIRHLKQEIEHLNTLLLSKDSHIDSLKQAMLLLENNQAKLTESPAPWWKFWKRS